MDKKVKEDIKLDHDVRVMYSLKALEILALYLYVSLASW
jgi:hypothetical protein